LQLAQVQQDRGINLNHNHQRNAMCKGAATTVINQLPDEPLNAAYQHWLRIGTEPNLARVSLAGKLERVPPDAVRSPESAGLRGAGKPVDSRQPL